MKRTLAALTALLACLLIAACGGGTALHGGRHHSQAFLKNAQHANLPTPHGLTAVLSLRGYDAVTVGNIPLGAPAAGCYTSGSFANCSAVKAREPRAHLVTIATWAGANGRILDTEPGDAVPSQDAGWIRRMIALHVYRPGIYADASEMVQVKADLNASGLKRSQYVLWVANWNGNPAIPFGFDAIQYRSTSTLDYDSFSLGFFHAAPKPLPVCVHHRLHRATCKADKAHLARSLRAEAASRRALHNLRADVRQHNCRTPHRKPYSRALCRRLTALEVKLEQRVRWFRANANRLQATV